MVSVKPAFWSVLVSARVSSQPYPDDTPFPSALVFAIAGNEPLHVVAAFDEEAKKVYIITAYTPSSDIFESDFTTRKKK